MPRQPRFVLPGYTQHILQRGNNHQAIFFNEKDYLYYLYKLSEVSTKCNCSIHSYVLMEDHVHLLLTPLDKFGISRMMQALGRCYVHYVNQAYHRSGTLWEGRYKATLIDPEKYVLMCYRYIELNPVRHNIALHPEGYRWSSYHRNALGSVDSVVSSHSNYQQLGSTNSSVQQAYRDLFYSHINQDSLKEIRDSINREWVLGGTHFKKKIQQLTQRQVSPKPRGGDRKSVAFRQSKKKTFQA